MRLTALASSLTLSLAFSVPLIAGANERHFTYTYETATLPAGQVEIEPWTTVRLGRDDYFVRFDHRLEVELGVTDTLMTALYLNLKGYAVEEGDTLSSGFAYEGISWEWKWKLMDPVADPVGLGLYFELSAGPAEAEVEAKLLLDKRIGNLLIALNAVGEIELAREDGQSEVAEVAFEVDAGVAWFFTPRVSLGLELRNHTELAREAGELEFEHSAFFAGPVLSVAMDRWWLALSVLPQVFAVKEHGDGVVDLEEHERIETRLLVGLHL